MIEADGLEHSLSGSLGTAGLIINGFWIFHLGDMSGAVRFLEGRRLPEEHAASEIVSITHVQMNTCVLLGDFSGARLPFSAECADFFDS